MYTMNKLITEHMVDNRFAVLYEPFRYYSVVLRQVVEVPTGFACDFESVPLFKGSCKRGGVVHDYFCRKNSKPVVNKSVAADLYHEVQELKDKDLAKTLNKGKIWGAWRGFLRWSKTSVVRVAPGYFHKHTVGATVDDLRGQ